MAEELRMKSEAEMRGFGASLADGLKAGDVVLLFGELGAGKTTLVRGYLEALGHQGDVRSPTFNLIQIFDTEPPVLHADLYRVKTYEGLGLEDYLDTHICFIEWADRAEGLLQLSQTYRIEIAFEGEGRRITFTPANPSV